MSLLVLCLAFALSACVRGVDLEVASPCDHPLFLATSFEDHASRKDRDVAALAGDWLQWTVIPSRGAAWAGNAQDASGPDSVHTLWVDAAAYRTSITFEQVADTEAPVRLDDAACAQENPPSSLVLFEPSRSEGPPLLRIAGRNEVLDEVADRIRSDDRLISEVEVADGLLEAKLWPSETADYGSLLTPLADQQPPTPLYTCNRYACVTTNLASAEPGSLPLTSLEPPFSVEDWRDVIAFWVVLAGLVAAIVVIRRRRNPTRASAEVPHRSPDIEQ